jgi:hypothetical protein
MSNADAHATVHGIIQSQHEASKRGALTIWTIYDRPKDHPDGFIARRFEAGHGPTEDTLTGELEELRASFWKAGLMRLSRQTDDEPQIVESWV